MNVYSLCFWCVSSVDTPQYITQHDVGCNGVLRKQIGTHWMRDIIMRMMMREWMRNIMKVCSNLPFRVI